MKTYNIATIPGDGIGPEIVAEGMKVLDAAASSEGFSINWIKYPFGADHYLETGETLPDSAIEEIGQTDAIYLGAIGDPRVRPGILEEGIILKLRFEFDQYVNLRPVKLFPNVETPIKGKGPSDIDFYVVRENTEDFYIGLGARYPEPRATSGTSGATGAASSASKCPAVHSTRSFTHHLKRKSYNAQINVYVDMDRDEPYAYQLGFLSKRGCERVFRYSFELARRKGKKKVTAVDKANVISYMYGLWRDTFEEVAKDYPDIQSEFGFADAVNMWFVKNPESFGVVVAPNLFGDIITDLGAMISGGLGLAAGGNINPDGISMFEPIHGSAPKYKGQGVINPLATILAGALMLETLGEVQAAQRVEKAVSTVLQEGKVRTKDLGGSSSTSEVGDAVASRI
ncbi:MAG TPA: 3-isopropylmalate dehydrogenase [Clostridia bacterium]|nr:3-isopropylmalate dehydrogenase [Clostridia bacterium]